MIGIVWAFLVYTVWAPSMYWVDVCRETIYHLLDLVDI